MPSEHGQQTVDLDTGKPIWDRFFSVHPLVLIGSREPDGTDDLAPKHLAMPVSWQNHFGFVCSETHATYRNIKREREFTVTYARPSQAVMTSLAASPRCDDGSKPITEALPTVPATEVQGVFLENGYAFLECELNQIIDGLGDNALIIGRVIAARVDESALRHDASDDQDLLHNNPLLAYLYPGRFAEIDKSNMLPFPAGFSR